MAFTDDVVLGWDFTEFAEALTAYTKHLSKVGLEVNLKKCATLDICVHKRKAGRRRVVYPLTLGIKNQAIPSLAVGETYKYLGIHVRTFRRDERRELYSICTESITKWLQNVTFPSLKPQQCI